LFFEVGMSFLELLPKIGLLCCAVRWRVKGSKFGFVTKVVPCVHKLVNKVTKCVNNRRRFADKWHKVGDYVIGLQYWRLKRRS
jgi:hypothetical protein